MVVGAFPLNGKIAVVTGAGSGINLAFAKYAEELGAKIVIADLQLTEDAKDFVARSKAKNSAIFVHCDVTKRVDLENLVTQSETQFGDVPDVFIAGAGAFEPDWSSFWDDTEEDGYKQVEINMYHPLKLSRIAIRSLVKSKKPGVILIVASLAGYMGLLGSPLYCATKHACVGFVRSVADLDNLKDIKVVLVAPGNVITPMWTDHPEKMKQFGFNAEEAVTPDEVAQGMIEMITEAKYGGGTCLQVSFKEKRILGTWNIDEPRGYGAWDIHDREDSGPVLEKIHAA